MNMVWMARSKDGVGVSLLIALTLVASTSLFTKYPPPGGDEPGFVDVAVNLLQRGVLGTSAYEGLLPGADRYIYWQPPVYFGVLAVWFKLVGVGLIQARLVSLLAAVAIVVFTYLIGKREASPIAALLGAALLSVSFWLVHPAAFARMDTLCVALTTASILTYGRARDRGSLWWATLGGILAGLAFLTHPLGIVAIATIGGHLVLTERLKVVRSTMALTVLVAFALTVFPWVLYILQDLDAFRAQTAAQLARKAQAGSYWLQFARAKTHTVSLLVTIGAAAWLTARQLRTRATSLVLVAFVFSFAAATYGREAGYFLHFYPFACAALAILIGATSRMRFVVFGAVALAFANEFAILGYDIYRYHHRDYDALTREVRAVIPPGKTVFIAPAEVSPYFSLLLRNPMRISVPTSTADPNAHRLAAEACDFIATTAPVTYLPDVNALLDGATPIVLVDQGPGYRVAIYDVRKLQHARPSK